MKNRFKLLTALTVATASLLFSAYATESHVNKHGEKAGNIIALKIDYGTQQPARSVQVPFKAGQTALEILQRAATVETHPVGKYVFVSGIDDVKGKRGDMAWYYRINGQPAKKLAFFNIINKPCHITWIYTKDRCSATVDGRQPAR
ncbi:DUF4430 domain-containing protein [Verrucomicrobiota bacterium]